MSSDVTSSKDVPARRRSRTAQTRPRSRRLTESVRAFYGALEDPSRLEDALIRTTRAFGGEIAHLLVTGPGRTISSSLLAGPFPTNVVELEAEYRSINPRIAAGHDLERSEVTYDARHSTPEQIARDTTYQEFFRPYGIDWYVGTRLVKDERAAVLFGVFRHDRHGHFSKAEIAEFGRICTHAATVVDLMLTRDAERIRGAASSVDAFAGCCAVMDKDGRVVETSERFLELARSSMLFRLEADGTFHCADARVRERVGALLCGITRASVDTRADLATQVLLARSPDGRLWRVRASPLPERLPWITPCGRCLVSIDQMSSTSSFHEPRLLIEAFGMTPAEAAVAVDLAEGTGLRDVATKRQVSYHTVRNQAKSILSKTGCRTQAELARLLSRLLA